MNKVISYIEFKKEIHKPFYENLLTEYILRPISNNLSFFLFRYFRGITANMVTAFSLLICILFGILFIFSNSYEILWVIGSILFMFFHILDTVDGDLARARNVFLNIKTINGSYFDALIHQYYNSIFFLTVGYSLNIYFGNIFIFYLGILFSLLIIITEIILLYIGIISNLNNLNKKKDFRNIKNSKEKKKITLKYIIVSFSGLIGFSFIFFIGSLLDYFLGFGYIKIFLFLLLGFSVVLLHITTFIRLLKLK